MGRKFGNTKVLAVIVSAIIFLGLVGTIMQSIIITTQIETNTMTVTEEMTVIETHVTSNTIINEKIDRETKIVTKTEKKTITEKEEITNTVTSSEVSKDQIKEYELIVEGQDEEDEGEKTEKYENRKEIK